MSSICIFPLRLPQPLLVVLWGWLVLVVVAITFTLASPLSHYPNPNNHQHQWCAFLRSVYKFVNEIIPLIFIKSIVQQHWIMH